MLRIRKKTSCCRGIYMEKTKRRRGRWNLQSKGLRWVKDVETKSYSVVDRFDFTWVTITPQPVVSLQACPFQDSELGRRFSNDDYKFYIIRKTFFVHLRRLNHRASIKFSLPSRTSEVSIEMLVPCTTFFILHFHCHIFDWSIDFPLPRPMVVKWTRSWCLVWGSSVRVPHRPDQFPIWQVFHGPNHFKKRWSSAIFYVALHMVAVEEAYPVVARICYTVVEGEPQKRTQNS